MFGVIGKIKKCSITQAPHFTLDKDSQKQLKLCRFPQRKELLSVCN